MNLRKLFNRQKNDLWIKFRYKAESNGMCEATLQIDNGPVERAYGIEDCLALVARMDEEVDRCRQ